MRYSEASMGRVFVIRLEQGEVVHTVIEEFAREKSVNAAAVISLGGADRGTRLVTGPEKGDVLKPGMPLLSHVLDAVHESSGVGTLFPNGEGEPVLHLHIACGRDRSATLGCARNGVVVWQYMEVIVLEIVGTDARRLLDKTTGFTLLNP